MKITSFSSASLNIPFRMSFRHASAERSRTQTLWVEARANAHTGYGEGCPRTYVTGESLTTAHAFVVAHTAQWRTEIEDIDGLRAWIQTHAQDIDRHPAAWCAAEMALLDCLGKETGRSLEQVLGHSVLSGSFPYTAVIGDGSTAAFADILNRYREIGFDRFKIKLSGDVARDREKIQLLMAAGVTPDRVRADANNLWASAAQAIAHLRAVDFTFWAMEEPLQTGDITGLQRIACEIGTRIILDESFQRIGQLDELRGPSQQWVLNLRVSKLGGLVRSLAVLDQARQRGLGVVVGAHVGETSLLTRAALTLAAPAQDVLLGHEGAVGTHLLEHDVVVQPVMFGKRGVLDVEPYGFAQRPGLGLDVRLDSSDIAAIT